jgi:hypothetical protein
VSLYFVQSFSQFYSCCLPPHFFSEPKIFSLSKGGFSLNTPNNSWQGPTEVRDGILSWVFSKVLPSLLVLITWEFSCTRLGRELYDNLPLKKMTGVCLDYFHLFTFFLLFFTYMLV